MFFSKMRKVWNRRVRPITNNRPQRRKAQQRHLLLLEALEDRTLLSVVTSVGPSLADSTLSAASLPPNSNHIGPDLLSLYERFAASSTSPAAAAAVTNPAGTDSLFMFDSQGRIAVEITAVDVNKVIPGLQQLGFQLTASAPDYHLIEGYLPVGSILDTTQLVPDGLMGVLPSYRPFTSAGLVDSEGDNALEADRVRATGSNNYDGTGVKVGIISDSYNALGGAAADILTGDLPATGVKVVQDEAGGTDEGRAMLQIVHDLAPGATLGFATDGGGIATMAQSILNLANPSLFGANVIADDIDEPEQPYFQPSLINAAIDVVTSEGVSYFSAAGNYQDQAYESTNVSFDLGVIAGINLYTGNLYHVGLYYNFGGGDTEQEITINNGQAIDLGLQWDQPFYTTYGVQTDLNFYLLNSSGFVVAAGTRDNVYTQTPMQFLQYTNNTGAAGNYYVVIENANLGPAPGRIKYVNFGANHFGPITFDTHATHSPTINPHAADPNAMAVAAAPFFNQHSPESFTSLGPATFLFDPLGNRLSSPEVVNKPDITAIDGVSTTFFEGSNGPNGFPIFFGTSAATPHAAAVAALFLQAHPGDTPSQVYAALKNSADPHIGSENPNLTGAGLIDAYRAIYGSPAPKAPNFTDGFESGALGQDWEAYKYGAGRIQVTTANGPASGSYDLTMDGNYLALNGYPPNMPEVDEAILHVNATGAANLTLSFQEKNNNVYSDPMNALPASFAGHYLGDGVALSVDGTNWYTLTSFTTTHTAYQTYLFNLSSLATAAGLTLGSDVRIRFQQYDPTSRNIANEGFVFDNISVTAAPTVSSISPNNGPTAGGTTVAISGNLFTGATAVLFGSTPATSFTVNSDSSITATAPAQSAGIVDVTVITVYGTSAANVNDKYTYVIPTVVTNPGNQTNNEGDSVNLAIQATNATSFGATGLPTGLSINTTTGVISGTIGAYAAGSYSATVTAYDGSFSSSANFTWTVNDTTLPSFTNPGSQTSTAGDTVSLATNPVDADPGSITATGLPGGLSIDSNTGVISGTLALNAVGNYSVTVTATDGTLVGSVSFSWTVNGASALVTSTADSGAGSLRQAILNANASSAAATILFDIPTSDPGYNAATGTWTIAPLSALPVLTAPVLLDGTSQPGYNGKPLIVLSGVNAGSSAVGLAVTGGNSTIKGLVINQFGGDGIDLTTNGGDVVAGDYIGTDATGTSAAGNGGDGVLVMSAGNTIGGTTAADRNVISGNKVVGVDIESANNNTVEGNYVGTNAAGTAALGNTYRAVFVYSSSGDVIGGTTAGAGNVLAGSTKYEGLGIYASTGVTVQGNRIGTNAAGNAALSNSGNGVEIENSSAITIGGSTAAARNIVSGNLGIGVRIYNGSGVTVQGDYIGTDVSGAVALGNGGQGVYMDGGSHGNLLKNNVISANATGVYIDGTVSGVLVQGNYIGTNAAGTSGLGNGTGVVVAGSNNTIGGATAGAGNLISGNTGNGVSINSGASGVQVQGNYIGTDVTGGSALGNGYGVVVAESNTTIGGTASGAGNLISGNRSGGVGINSGVSGVAVQGNFIGTNAAGTSALGNEWGIVAAGSNNTIGGTTAAARNLISGNTVDGISINSGVSGVQVQGNYIGIDVTGTSALGNGDGLDVYGSNNTIGGTASGARNVISGNSADGVLLESTASGVSVQGNYIGTDTSGGNSVANSIGVSAAGSNNTIGGNVISGNTGDGVFLSVSGVLVQGNYIGTDAVGASALGNGSGVVVAGANNTIGGTTTGAGNLISGNTGDGISINSGVSGVQVQGDYIGTDVTGTSALGNGAGIVVAGSNNAIGGATTGAGNLISGNAGDGISINSGASGVQVQGNFIGTNAAGTSALANGAGVVVAESNNTIGGTASGAGNLISANTAAGISINSGVSGVAVQGNFIGTNAAGTSALGNEWGIVAAGTNNTIGGTTAAARNLISGNTVEGISINSGVTGIVVQGNYIGTDLTGALAVANSVGIEAAGSNNTVGGTTSGARNVISGNSYGVVIDSGVSGVQVQGNYIGTDVTGTKAVANYTGTWVAGSDNTVGGTTTAARNVISGNSFGVVIDSDATGVQVQGNYVGTDVTGAKALANYDGVYVLGSSNAIGGSVLGARNFISGNGNDGVVIASGASGNQVLGNFIGVGVSGTNGIGNVANGIEIAGSSNTIGGTLAGYRNVISSSGNDGVLIDGTGANNLLQGNFVGTDYSGNNALANSGSGIEIQGTGNTVGGTASGARNILVGNSKDGVRIDSSASGTLVQGDWIGVNFLGAALSNGGNGLGIAGNGNIVGGTVTAARNIISGNTNDGVLIASGASGNQVLGNFIGTDITGTKPLANSIGIEVAGNSNTIGGGSGARNLISGNSSDGVKIDSGGSGNVVLGNYIGVNTYDLAVVGNSGNGIEVAGNSNTIGASYAVAPNEISGNSNDGVLLDSTSSGNQVLGNYIGTNHGGSASVANKIGIEDAGSSNTLGGSVLGARNLISGNTGDGVLLDSTATAETIEGNDIGVNISGNAALANGANGVEVQGTGNIIGGNAANYFVRNFISGNGNDGVLIHSSASGNQVAGNFIGVGANGTTKMGNGANGIEIAGSSNTLGGTLSGNRNVISGSGSDGVLIDGTGTNNLLQGNFIGTDYSARFVTSNSGNGIEIQGTGNTIGGGSGARNLISGNRNDGVKVDSGASGNLVEGNNIGVNIYDNAAVGNSGNGIEIAGNSNTLGASYAVAPNEISGNSNDGVLLDSGSSGNQVLGNYIGSNHGGTAALANKIGIEDAGSSNTIGGSVLGARNLISGNSGDGVLLDSTATAEVLWGNYIGLNVGGNTILGNGGNGVEVQGTGNTIGGNSGTNYFFRNFISGNKSDGVLFDSGASGNQVLGNFIGLGVSGTNGIGNVANDIEIAGSSNTIGGTLSGNRNVISGSGNDGVLIDSTGTNNLLQGNFVGTDYTGKNPVANSGNGIEIAGNNNTVGGTVSGAGNVISGNSKNGVLVSAGSGDTISRNSIFANGALGISLASGANNNIAAAGLSSATLSGSTLTVTGVFNAPTANVAYVLEFFANLSGDGEGRVYLGSLTVTPTSTGTQNFTFTTTTTVTGTYPLITATLTDATGDTSAFSTGVVS